jgi:hypothetical protein
LAVLRGTALFVNVRYVQVAYFIIGCKCFASGFIIARPTGMKLIIA